MSIIVNREANMDNKDKIIQVRVEAELHEEIKAAAEEENRTISNLIRTAMIAYLKQRKSK